MWTTTSARTPPRGYNEPVYALRLDDDHLVFDFPYDPSQVAEIKAIRGAKWDKVGRVWRLPMNSLVDARGFADKHGFTVDPRSSCL